MRIDDNVRTLPQEELAAFYERHSPAVFRLCMSYLRNTHDAADAVQDTFLKWLAARPQLENERHEIGWLVMTAGNVCRDILRKRRRHPQESLDAAYGLGSEESGFGRTEVFDAVAALPDKYKNVIFLFYYEDMSTAEISRVTGIRKSTVTSLLTRGRRLLKKALGDDDDEKEE